MATDFSPEILDQIPAGAASKQKGLAGEDGLFRRLKKGASGARAGCGADPPPCLAIAATARAKALLTGDGEIEIEVPRDRAGKFEPVIVATGQTRFDGFERSSASSGGHDGAGDPR